MANKIENLRDITVEFDFSQNVNELDLSQIQKEKSRLLITSYFGDKSYHDLEFLRNYPYKDSIREICVTTYVSSLETLAEFHSLRSLIIGNVGEDDKFDFEKYPNLKHLSVTGEMKCENSKIATLESLKLSESKSFPIEKIHGLKKLYLRKVRVQMQQISHMKSLEELELIQLPIRNLDGLESLKCLSKLSIAYCRALKDYNALAKCSSLLELELMKVNGVQTKDLAKLKNLEKLILDIKELPSINFIQSMPKLKFFSFLDTDILDGDLTPCLRLEYAAATSKRHYNLKDSQLPKWKNSDGIS